MFAKYKLESVYSNVPSIQSLHLERVKHDNCAHVIIPKDWVGGYHQNHSLPWEINKR